MSGKTLDVNAWIDAALTAILEDGLSAVAVEPLARALGVTKGSFYWHFRDRDALLGAMVDRWAERTETLIDGVTSVAAPADRIAALIDAVHGSPEGVKSMRAMSALASHGKLGKRVKEIATRRHRFLARSFRDLGLGASRSEAAARLVHAATVGVGDLEALGVGPATAAERRAYVAALVAFVRSAKRQ